MSTSDLTAAAAVDVAVDTAEQQQQPPPTAAIGAAAQPVPSAQTEKTEEEKLLAKYPTAGSGLRGNGPSGHSAFLQKRLQKGVSVCCEGAWFSVVV